MFLGQIFAKNVKNDPKALWKRQNRLKNKISKILVKFRNDVKCLFFTCFMLTYNSAIFEDIDLKMCKHIHQPLLSNVGVGVLEILILMGKVVKKEKKMFTISKCLEIFQNLLSSR